MRTLKVSVEIPILDRGKDVFGKPILNDDIERNVSYVLNIFLQNYCQYIGAPKFGPISANGKIQEGDD